jgi:hypothetical protein
MVQGKLNQKRLAFLLLFPIQQLEIFYRISNVILGEGVSLSFYCVGDALVCLFIKLGVVVVLLFQWWPL